jgi:hypothetical protein
LRMFLWLNIVQEIMCYLLKAVERVQASEGHLREENETAVE